MTACMASTKPPTVIVPATTGETAGALVPMANATSGSPTRATTLMSVRACTVLPLDLTPYHRIAVNTRITPNASADTTRASVLTNTLPYSATTMETAAPDALDETQSLQPTTNPANGPKTSLAK